MSAARVGLLARLTTEVAHAQMWTIVDVAAVTLPCIRWTLAHERRPRIVSVWIVVLGDVLDVLEEHRSVI